MGPHRPCQHQTAATPSQTPRRCKTQFTRELQQIRKRRFHRLLN
ncbi:hypothetical protein COLO4_26907 [Corchorus olitorius]|uniref:Uncharacterized protein n=1 Tax=Corchorus olitorius TaxID=93759 RepID=A0A1R3HTS6_9ROSI|nr:hypothetical protein COLO4_26907 [Corchorus olitorius]